MSSWLPGFNINVDTLVMASDAFVAASHRQTSHDLMEEYVALLINH